LRRSLELERNWRQSLGFGVGGRALKRLAVTVALAIAIPVSLAFSTVPDTGSIVIRVPQDVATVQEAVTLAGPGDVVLLDRGSYPGGVVVPPSKRGITIRGVDRNAVVFDGADRRDNAIVVHADGVALRNLSAHNFLENGFYWDGVQGFSGSYLTVWNVLGYGIYAEDSTDGLIERDYVSGAADAAYYVGECAPCRTTLRKLVARLSAVGYSGTNASGKLVIRDSLWDRNGAGILPNSYANEKDPPQRNALIVGNTVVRSGWARVPLHTPLAGFYGIGIGIAGGNGNRVLRNRVVGSRRFGIALFRTDYLISLDPRPKPPGAHRPWRPLANSIRGNTVRRSATADLALSAGARGGNCFRRNAVASTFPRRLQARPCSAVGGDDRVSRMLEMPILSMIAGARRAIRPVPYKVVPQPPPQPNAPN
jgi:parallel beta helix pectate lyase-like protein